MRKFQIISDGSCDLSPQTVKDNNIIVVPFYVSMDGQNYLKEGIDISVRDFYQQMVDKSDMYPKTSLPSIADYYSVFEPLAAQGIDILCICISTKFSGSYNSAMGAKDLCLEKYPDAKIFIVDALMNTCLQGLLVLEAAKMQQIGMNIEDVVERINVIIPTGRIYFMVGNLEYLRRGGRIGRLVGLVGATLKIKPIIVLRDGEIFSSGITFTRKKAIIKVIDLVKKYFQDIGEKISNYVFVAGCGYDQDEAEDFSKKLSEQLGIGKIKTEQIGATIAVHTGPFPLGVGFIKRYDAV